VTAAPAPPPDPLPLLNAGLEAAAKFRELGGDFDMEDGPEANLLAPFPELHAALTWLGENVTAPWRAADTAALGHQDKHEKLAKTAILAGTAAIVLAVLQLALKLSLPGFAALAAWVEGVTVLAGVAAVAVGLLAKFDHQWLGQRHKAERLRMLKFQSLGRSDLWRGNLTRWQQWVRDRITELEGVEDIQQMEKWSGHDDPDPLEDGPAVAPHGDATNISCALAIYYRYKRLKSQAAYFKSKGDVARGNWALRCHQLQLPLFFASICCVLLHFCADVVASHVEDGAAAHVWEMVALWGIVLAAVLPVIGVGVRTYSSAFELSRKARSFEGKHQAMLRAAVRLEPCEKDLSSVLAQIHRNEALFELEHREWLRLLLDVEWFL